MVVLKKILFLVIILAIFAMYYFVAFSQPKLTGSVSGTVTDPLGRPLAEAKVEVYSGNLLVKSITTFYNGMFYIELNPGTYQIKISKEGFVTKTLTIMIRGFSHVDLGKIELENALRVSMFPSYIRIPMGEGKQIPFTVYNNGDVDLSCDIIIISKEINAKVLFSSLEINSFMILSKESKNLILQLEPHYKTGMYFVNLTITPSHGLSINRTIKIEVYNPISKFLLCVLPAKIYMSGETATYDITISNPFNIDVFVEFNIKYPKEWTAYVSTTGGERIKSLLLKAREVRTLKIICKIPSETKSGNYDIVLNVTLSNPGYELNINDSIKVRVIIEEGKPLLNIKVENPVLDVYSGSTAKFELSISNLGTGDAIVDLKVEGLPKGYSYSVQDTKGNVISSIYLAPMSTKKIILVIKVPYGEQPSIKEFNFLAKIRGGSLLRTSLGLNILGRYEISYKTEIFSLEMPIGGTSIYKLTIENSGANEVTSVRVVMLHVPSGFNVSISPVTLESLKPGESYTFTITISSSSDLNAGDYYLTFKVVSSQVETDVRQLRVTLYQRTEMIYIAIALLFIVIIIITFIYRKYGRR